MVEIKRRKTDRRTLYTIRVIKDTFIKLVKEESYSKVTITKFVVKLILLVLLSIYISHQ